MEELSGCGYIDLAILHAQMIAMNYECRGSKASQAQNGKALFRGASH
jgi:hypothetical protein